MEIRFLHRSYTRGRMNRSLILAGIGLLSVTVFATEQAPSSPAATPDPQTTLAKPSDPQTALVKQYCAGCHSERGKSGGLSLASFDATTAAQHADVAEKMIRKLRAGMMPPPGARRPDEAALSGLATALENRIDQAAATAPNPGHRPFQRLNRVEYARAIKDLLALDVDVN